MGDKMEKEYIKAGNVINELTILEQVKKPENPEKYKDWNGSWVKCKCSCGNEIIVPTYGIERGLIKSCGHLKGEMGGENLKEYYKTHNPSNTIYLRVEGETKSISEWSRITQIPRSTLISRINKHLPLEEILRKD